LAISGTPIAKGSAIGGFEHVKTNTYAHFCFIDLKFGTHFLRQECGQSGQLAGRTASDYDTTNK
jgi:hypothetical protein